MNQIVKISGIRQTASKCETANINKMGNAVGGQQILQLKKSE
jgi:hypothetical protein